MYICVYKYTGIHKYKVRIYTTCVADLLVADPLSFHLSENAFIASLFLRDIFPGYRILA